MKLLFSADLFSDIPEVKALFKGLPFPKHYSDNLSLGDAYELIMLIESQLPTPPSWLKPKKPVLAIGGKGTIFSMGLNEIEQPAYITKEQIWDLIFAIATEGIDQKKTRKAVETAVSLSLIYALMDHFEIENLTYLPTQ